MLFKQTIKPHKFEYHPLVYDPKKEDNEERHRIHFPRHYTAKKKGGKQLWLLFLLIIVVLLIEWLGGIQRHQSVEKVKFKNVEEVR